MLLHWIRIKLDNEEMSFKTVSQLKRSLHCRVPEDVDDKLTGASLTFQVVPVRIVDGVLTIWEQQH
jgi:hypothetical protein